MESRKSESEYLNEALQFIEKNNLEDLQARLNVTVKKTISINETYQEQTGGFAISGFQGEMKDETYRTWEEKVDYEVTEPAVNLNKHGDALLQAAIQSGNIDIAKHLLLTKQIITQRRQGSVYTFSAHPTNISLAITPTTIELMNKTFNSKKEKSQNDPVILANIYIKFVKDNFQDTKLMMDFFKDLNNSSLKNVHPEAFKEVVEYGLLDVIEKKNDELFKVLYKMDVTKQIINEKIDDNPAFKKKMTIEMKMTHEPELLTTDRARMLNDEFEAINNKLLNQIGLLKKGVDTSNWTFHKSQRQAEMLKLVDRINLLDKNLTSVEKFEKLIAMLIDARNAISKDVKTSWTAWESSVLNKIDSLISTALQNQTIKSIFTLRDENTGYSFKKLIYAAGGNDNYVLLNETIKNKKLRSESELTAVTQQNMKK